MKQLQPFNHFAVDLNFVLPVIDCMFVFSVVIFSLKHNKIFFLFWYALFLSRYLAGFNAFILAGRKADYEWASGKASSFINAAWWVQRCITRV